MLERPEFVLAPLLFAVLLLLLMVANSFDGPIDHDTWRFKTAEQKRGIVINQILGHIPHWLARITHTSVTTWRLILSALAMLTVIAAAMFIWWLRRAKVRRSENEGDGN